MKTNAAIFDIDGVILTCPYWEDIEEFYQNVSSCTPIDWSVFFVKSLHENGIKIIFSTARNVKVRGITTKQLKDCFDFDFDLYMRGRCDERPDCVIKQEFLQQIQEKHNVVLAVDDNESNCNMYRENNINTIRVY